MRVLISGFVTCTMRENAFCFTFDQMNDVGVKLNKTWVERHY